MIPNARKIVVNDETFYWSIKSYTKDRYNLGWTPPILQLTIQKEKQVSQFILTSTVWTSEHEIAFFDEPSMSSALPHKVETTPDHIRQIIEHDFAVLDGIKIGDWIVKRK